MATPPEVTMADISGKFLLNKAMSTTTEMDQMLTAQGVGYMARTAISLASITLHVRDYEEDGVEKIDIIPVLTGGIKTSPEKRTLNGKQLEKPQPNLIFGDVVGKSQRASKEQLQELHGDKQHILDGWSDESFEHRGGIILSHAWSWTETSGLKWGAVQTWGFKDINGERRHVREVYFMPENGVINLEKDIKATLVYDYLGPLDE